MTSKRASGNESESEMKRAKLDECVAEYDVVLGDKLYVNVDMLFKCAQLKSFFFATKRYNRSALRFIEEEKLVVVYVTKDNVQKGVHELKTLYARNTDVRLVEKDERIMHVITSAKESLYPPAPPVITDQDLTFFKDKHGASYKVEMRGKRTMEEIYFRALDVATVFKSDRLMSTLLDQRTTYQATIDYAWFSLPKDVNSANPHQGSDTSKQGHPQKSDIPVQEQEHHSLQEPKQPYKKQEVFLTFFGLMRALQVTRSSTVAEQFRVWVYLEVFALAYGTVEQKKELLATLCKVDKSFLQAFMKLVPNDLACIYLVETTMRDGEATVYKFGRSGKVKDRFYDHHATFGTGTLLDSVIFVPPDQLSEAEAILHNSIADEAQFRFNKTEELVTLDASGRKAVRTIMQTIADKYNGSMTIQASKHLEEMKALKTTYDLHVKDLECNIAVLNKEAEKVMDRLESQKENQKLRHENAQLKADAKDRQLEEKDERIRRLEETIRQLSKRVSEPEYRP